MHGPRGLAASLPLLAAVLSLGGCTSHPVGPARTYETYQAKAVTTAESALSAVETVRLTVRTATTGHALGPWLSAVVGDAEESSVGVQGTFDSIQPPDRRADGLRLDLDEILTDAVEHLAQVRIAVRRGALATLADAATPLDADRDRLEAFAESHR